MSEPNVSAMTAPQAQLRLDQLQADPAWGAKLVSRDAATYAEFDALSRKVAGVEAAAPTPVSKSAQVTLDRFTSDPTLAKKLLAGDPDTNKRFHELTAAVANSDGRDLLTETIVHGAAAEQPFNDITFANQLSSRNARRRFAVGFHKATARPGDAQGCTKNPVEIR
jgi:hypothetical protein